MAKSALLSSISSVVKNPRSEIEAEAYLIGTSQEPIPEDAPVISTVSLAIVLCPAGKI